MQKMHPKLEDLEKIWVFWKEILLNMLMWSKNFFACGGLSFYTAVRWQKAFYGILVKFHFLHEYDSPNNNLLKYFFKFYKKKFDFLQKWFP